MFMKLCSFAELNESAQETAISHYRDNMAGEDFTVAAGITVNEFKDIMAILGFNITDVYYSVSHCQGDGASYTSGYAYAKNWRNNLTDFFGEGSTALTEWVNFGERLHLLQRPRFYSLTCTINAQGRYNHSNSMEIESGYDYKLEADLLTIFRAMADKLYNDLLKDDEYVYDTSTIVENITNNESLVYDRKGRLIDESLIEREV